MLAKRIIPCLDVKGGRVVKGINFVNIRDAGDPVEAARQYNAAGADELVFLDISATLEERGTLLDMVRRVAEQVFIPFTVGGGIRTSDDIRATLTAGADKVSLNSAAVLNPELVREASDRFGSQCIVVAIDVKRNAAGRFEVVIAGGTRFTGLDALEWAKQVEKLGAGEILLTSMDRDGTKSGFDNEITRQIADAVGPSRSSPRAAPAATPTSMTESPSAAPMPYWQPACSISAKSPSPTSKLIWPCAACPSASTARPTRSKPKLLIWSAAPPRGHITCCRRPPVPPNSGRF